MSTQTHSLQYLEVIKLLSSLLTERRKNNNIQNERLTVVPVFSYILPTVVLSRSRQEISEGMIADGRGQRGLNNL